VELTLTQRSETMSWKQSERQKTREKSGQYAKMNPCECCGKSAGADYYSDDRCNRLGGHGLVLCWTCCERLSGITEDAQYLAALGVDKQRT
jgi:hypothetical protein